ncbi:hypothetical protein GCM10009104_14860 [Marinobacterium maritimum]|uniref:DUF3530 domain-containing protein n=1 Tax=Marinobacterium maritimum TaxID=500162 RepID=A0ABN1I579_9GAMM
MLKFAPLLLCILSSHSLAAEPARHSAGVDSVEQQILQQIDHSHELLDIQADADRFSLLYRPAMTPTPHGALLIVPDPGVAEGWLEQVHALANYLPEHGWAVLALEPPAVPTAKLPKRTLPVMTGIKPRPATPAAETEAEVPAALPVSATAPAETTDTATSAAETPAYREQLQQRLKLAWQELEQRNEGKQKVVVGIGQGAVWSTALAIASGEETSLVLVDPRPDVEAEDSLNDLLKALEAHSVIDLYHSPLPGYPDAEPDARQRRLQAARLGLTRYHQSRLPGVFRGWRSDMPWLVRHTRGLLERILLDAQPEEESDATPAPLMQAPPGLPALPQNGTAGRG